MTSNSFFYYVISTYNYDISTYNYDISTYYFDITLCNYIVIICRYMYIKHDLISKKYSWFRYFALQVILLFIVAMILSLILVM